MSYMFGDQEAVVLEEEIADNYEPDYQEILDYAEFLGMDLQKDQEYFYIAKEGLKAPLPNPWKPIQNQNGDLFFYNFQTGDTIQEHP
jgi:centrosomal protein CEP164